MGKRKPYQFLDKPCEACGDLFTPRNGKHKFCSSCSEARKNKWNKENKDYYKKYRENHLEKAKDYMKDYRVRKYSEIQEAQLRINLSKWASPQEVECIVEVWKVRTGICTICGVSEEETGKAMAVDHCHETNTFRGFLCHRCNTGLAWFNDDPGRMRLASLYLKWKGF